MPLCTEKAFLPITNLLEVEKFKKKPKFIFIENRKAFGFSLGEIQCFICNENSVKSNRNTEGRLLGKFPPAVIGQWK